MRVDDEILTNIRRISLLCKQAMEIKIELKGELQ